MDKFDFAAQIAQQQKGEIQSLRTECENLQKTIETLTQNLTQKDLELTSLSNYINELESRNAALLQTIKQKDTLIAQIESNAQHFGTQIDELLNMLLNLEHKHSDGEAKNFTEFRESVHFGEDKEFLFGLNIDDAFIAQNSYTTIKYYLFNLDCKFAQTFDLPNLHPQSKQDLHLIGETFSALLRLESYRRNDGLRGIIEVLPADMLTPAQIRYYGNLDIREDFENFVRSYSHKTT
ncbi:hypothetical protein [uncultured Helicobacter sp.]|uniref:hypothetical protein n=1 Tax=uncultured Helicobacter sp. TaxID=175537 RepID=UPI00374F6EDE